MIVVDASVLIVYEWRDDLPARVGGVQGSPRRKNSDVRGADAFLSASTFCAFCHYRH